MRASALFSPGVPRTRPPVHRERAVADELLKQITAGLFDDEDATTGDEDSVAGLPTLKDRQFLRVRRSMDESVRLFLWRGAGSAGTGERARKKKTRGDVEGTGHGRPPARLPPPHSARSPPRWVGNPLRPALWGAAGWRAGVDRAGGGGDGPARPGTRLSSRLVACLFFFFARTLIGRFLQLFPLQVNDDAASHLSDGTACVTPCAALSAAFSQVSVGG